MRSPWAWAESRYAFSNLEKRRTANSRKSENAYPDNTIQTPAQGVVEKVLISRFGGCVADRPFGLSEAATRPYANASSTKRMSTASSYETPVEIRPPLRHAARSHSKLSRARYGSSFHRPRLL